MDGNPNEVCFVESGSGGPEEFSSRVDDAQYLYGLRKSVVQYTGASLCVNVACVVK